VMKEHLGRLPSAVQRAVNESREHALLNDATHQLVMAGQEWLDTFNALSDGVMLLDLDGRVRRLNRAAEILIGAPAGEIEGRPARDLLGLMCSDPESVICPDLIGSVRFEVGPCERSGMWFEVACDPIDGTGHPSTGYVVVFTDITARKHSEEQLRAVMSRLRRTMEGSVAIAVRMVESRDPYTAGHQERVSELAVAIAQRMGCASDQVELIRTAALLHDIGKIAVPAEILVRPGQLQELEWEFIKRHPTKGAEILRDAEFEGPIREIVWQHHERLDGSGYPRGLSGDEIRREALIVAVADVAEAMTAHRPYRPACTDEQVTAELAGGSGTKYAPDVVAACLAHLRDNGRLPSSQ